MSASDPRPGWFINLAAPVSPMRSASSALPRSSSRSAPAQRPARALAVVLSACKGVTDELLELVALAERQQHELARRGWRRCASGTPALPRRCWRRAPRREYLSDLDRDIADLDRRAADHERDALGGAEVSRPGRGLRRDLVDAPVLSAICKQRGVRARRAMDRRAPLRHGRVGTAGSGGAVAATRRRAAAAAAAPPRRRARSDAGHHRLHRHRSARRADHARAQRQRFLGLDLRCAAGRGRDSYLDRRRRRAVGRPAARARRPGHRLAVVQRGHGAGLLRRQGDSSADHGAGGRTRHPDLDPQYLCARRSPAR